MVLMNGVKFCTVLGFTSYWDARYNQMIWESKPDASPASACHIFVSTASHLYYKEANPQLEYSVVIERNA